MNTRSLSILVEHDPITFQTKGIFVAWRLSFSLQTHPALSAAAVHVTSELTTSKRG
jgi:hypothetical protein